MRGSVNSIETFGLVDGPGIRNVIFLNGCKLRCKFCHNPEMWNKLEFNYEPKDIYNKVIRFKTYFGKKGGVTFSGGEPLLQPDFVIETCKLLKEADINIAIDTAGIGTSKNSEVLDLVDIVLLDIKHVDKEGYIKVTGMDMLDEFEEFVDLLNSKDKIIWIRQVIVPGINDNMEYLVKLKKYLKKIKNIERIDFLPYHTMGKEKYDKLGIDYPLLGLSEMDKEKCNELYNEFMKLD